MSDVRPENTPSEKPQNPYTQVGITTALIAACTLSFKDPDVLALSSIACPFLGYGVVTLYERWDKKRNLKEYCSSIDSMVQELELENANPNTKRQKRVENDKEIARLRQQKRTAILKKYKIE